MSLLLAAGCAGVAVAAPGRRVKVRLKPTKQVCSLDERFLKALNAPVQRQLLVEAESKVCDLERLTQTLGRPVDAVAGGEVRVCSTMAT